LLLDICRALFPSCPALYFFDSTGYFVVPSLLHNLAILLYRLNMVVSIIPPVFLFIYCCYSFINNNSSADILVLLLITFLCVSGFSLLFLCLNCFYGNFLYYLQFVKIVLQRSFRYFNKVNST